MQLGFNLDYTDPVTGGSVPWAEPTSSVLGAIRNAPWKVVDVETTNLNPASTPLSVSGKDARRGVNPTPRLRVVSVLYPTDKGIDVKSFDMDKLTQAKRAEVCAAVLNNVFFGHNSGFDLYWLRLLSKVIPRKVLDSMLIARALFPQQPLELAKMANDENEDIDFKTQAIQAFEQKRSGWALADLSLTVLHKYVAKDMQGPKNWCEPFLTQEAYDYATGDVVTTYALLCKLLGIEYGDDILQAYLVERLKHKTLQLLEPQVLDIVLMRENGMPWKVEDADRYVIAQHEKVAELAARMIKMEPSLENFRLVLADADAGVTAPLKEAIGEAFRRRGLVLETTEKTAAPKIGEKDLRRAQAAINENSKDLFEVWTSLMRAKKAANMAVEFSGFAIRSGDGRIHSNIGHGPATGRLASSEPNVQQAPRDQGFRNAVAAPPGYKVIGSDYSALDMRVGAALAIRAQRQIREAFEGKRKVEPEVALAIKRIYLKQYTLSQCKRLEAQAAKKLEDWKKKKDEILKEFGDDARKSYWDKWRKLSREVLITRFQRCLADVTERARKAGTPEWGSLRDAFSIKGMDIHTWTALAMNGEDPVALFSGKSNDEVVAELKKQKKALGPKRMSGKVSNLSLTYAMQVAGFLESAAKIHNIHWTFEEAAEVRTKWLASYVEMDLWHCWTQLNPACEVYVPDPERGNRFVRKPAFASVTLGNRLIYAFGLNAGLAYEDQSTGADILGTVMDRLHREYPEVFATVVNQIHDELVFVVNESLVESYTEIITRVMEESAEKFLMPYGVHAEVSPAIGDVWLKD